jgi:hypothetical protein
MKRGARRPRRAPRHRRRVVTAGAWPLGAALTLLVASLASPSAAQGPGAPIDRAVVAIPPVYPAPAPGLLRLPETRSAPIGPARALSDLVPGGVAAVPPGAPADRPIWTSARLEPVVGLDARGRITSILEYTPGRFDR